MGIAWDAELTRLLVERPPPSTAAQKEPPWDSVPPELLDELQHLWDDRPPPSEQAPTTTPAIFSGAAAAAPANLFRGVVICVNGWTDGPLSSFHLQRLVVRHGGRVKYFYSKKVTHWVATELSASKRAEVLRHFGKRSSVRVISAMWIVDSLAARVLLPVDRYLTVRPPGAARLRGVKPLRPPPLRTATAAHRGLAQPPEGSAPAATRAIERPSEEPIDLDP